MDWEHQMVGPPRQRGSRKTTKPSAARRLFVLLAALLLIAQAQPAFAGVPEPEEILAQAAVLMDADTGQVLYEKNAHQARQPASITKIMTAMLALECLEVDETLTASAAAVDIPYWGSSAYIQAGERLTVEEALYAMMLRSANEAANILAEEVAGSMDAFADFMNRRAAQLGAENTHFVNANGLPSRRHLTTAYDMALITRQALETPGFLDYFGADSYAMAPTNLGNRRTFTNTHRMLRRGDGEYNPYVLGGKTGYTMSSGYTLVTVARREGRTLICVVLDSPAYYTDTGRLLDFGFEEFSLHTVVLEEESLQVSLLENGWEAGVATLHGPQAVSLLLHRSVRSSDIAVVYEVPRELELGEELEASLVLSASSEAQGLPETLLNVPLEAEVETFAPPAVEAALAVVVPQERAETAAFPLGVVALLVVMAGGAAWVICSWRRRRRGRRIMQNRRIWGSRGT